MRQIARTEPAGALLEPLATVDAVADPDDEVLLDTAGLDDPEDPPPSPDPHAVNSRPPAKMAATTKLRRPTL
jgi:hypothetical protein